MLELTKGISSPATLCLNDYTTLRAKVNGKINSASFEIIDPSGNEVQEIYYHRPPEINYPREGYVELSFDPASTIKSGGIYTLKLTVNYTTGSGTIKTDVFEQRVEFQTKSILQWYIDELRVALGDDISLSKYVPSRFYIRDANYQLWTDEELKKFLDLALLDINNTHPVNIKFSYNHPGLPINFLIYGAMVRALTAFGLIEVYNWYDTTAPVKVSLYKGDKLKDFATWVQQSYLKPLEEYKKSFAYYTTRSKILVLTKMPFRVIRPLSMLFGYHNFFTG